MSASIDINHGKYLCHDCHKWIPVGLCYILTNAKGDGYCVICCSCIQILISLSD